MSRQQSRSPGDGAIDPSLAQKKRARHRLVGAICLCLLAAVVVPLVLESEPRPARDLPLELAATPAGSGAQQAQPDAGGHGASGVIATVNPAASGARGELEPPAESLSAVKTITPTAAVPAVQPPVAAASPAPAAPAKGDKGEKRDKGDKVDASRADASKGGSAAKSRKEESGAAAKQESSRKEAAAPPAKADPAPRKESGRDGGPDVIARLIERADPHPKEAPAAAPATRKFLVQIGAYSNVQSARNMSERAAQAGLRPYQETVKTAQGDWIRVRVGPLPPRQDAERAQQDLKRAGVTAAIIAL
jgi:DedD protein